jgi:poly-gamma-glutamate synthesis protein (capsule biosynthesis protein)
MRIIFTGDLFLGGDLSGKDATNIINVAEFHSADKKNVNLEQPISDNKYVEDKCTIYTGS